MGKIHIAFSKICILFKKTTYYPFLFLLISVKYNKYKYKFRFKRIGNLNTLYTLLHVPLRIYENILLKVKITI